MCTDNDWLSPGVGVTLLPAAVGALPGQVQHLVFEGASWPFGADRLQACFGALAHRVLRPPHMTHLACLSVEGLIISDEGACALAAALAGMPQLRTLKAGNCSMSAAGGASAMSALGFHCPQLCELDLAGNSGLGDAAVQLFQPRHPPFQLEYLDLGSCGLTAVACKAMCNQQWPRLRVLVLDGNRYIGSSAAYELGGAGQHFPALNALSLVETGIDAFPPPDHAHRWPMLCVASLCANGNASDSSDGDASDSLSGSASEPWYGDASESWDGNAGESWDRDAIAALRNRNATESSDGDASGSSDG